MVDQQFTATGSAGVSPARSEGEMRQVIRELITEYSPISEPANIVPETRLVEDLEYHSLALIELSFTLEDEFDLNNIDESVARRITTVGDIEEYVVSEVRNREAAI